MESIKVEKEVIRGMAGPVTYFTKPCPYGEKPMSYDGKSAMVGSVQCKMCQHHGGQTEESVKCNHG